MDLDETAAHDDADGVDSSTRSLSQVVRVFGSGPKLTVGSTIFEMQMEL